MKFYNDDLLSWLKHEVYFSVDVYRTVLIDHLSSLMGSKVNSLYDIDFDCIYLVDKYAFLVRLNSLQEKYLDKLSVWNSLRIAFDLSVNIPDYFLGASFLPASDCDGVFESAVNALFSFEYVL